MKIEDSVMSDLKLVQTDLKLVMTDLEDDWLLMKPNLLTDLENGLKSI